MSNSEKRIFLFTSYEIDVIATALGELPYKVSAGTASSLRDQLVAYQHADVKAANPPPPPAPAATATPDAEPPPATGG